MKTHEVSFEIFKQFLINDAPIIAYENESWIRFYTMMGGYEFCYIYSKSTPEATIIFKDTYITKNPRIIYPLRQINNNPSIKIVVEGEQDDLQT